MAAALTPSRLRLAICGLLLLASLGYLTAGGSLRSMLSMNAGHLSLLRLQFATDASQQTELRRQASTKLDNSLLTSDWHAAYSKVQLALAPVSSCPALKEKAQAVYSLSTEQQQELARWIESNSVIPICLERNDLDNASAYYDWAEKAVPGLTGSYIRLSSRMASAFVGRAFERYDGGNIKAAEADWSAGKSYLGSAPYESFGDVAEKVAIKHRKAQQSLLASDLAANPTSGIVRIYLSQAYNAASQGHQAFDTIAPLLQTAQEDSRVWQQYGQALIGMNRLPEAEEALQKAVRLAPNDLQALNRLGVLYQATGQAERADALFRQALAAPGGADAYWVWEHLGDVLVQEGKRSEALQAYTTAIAKAPPELQASARKKLGEMSNGQ
jgi:tetratricopeptide (TPR) repeat protein